MHVVQVIIQHVGRPLCLHKDHGPVGRRLEQDLDQLVFLGIVIDVHDILHDVACGSADSEQKKGGEA